MAEKIRKVVLAYSGGLDTSIIIRWLIERYNCEVIAVTIDLGQGEELKPLRKKALSTGASKIYIEDLKREFAEEYIFPTLKAGAIYESRYLLGTSFARPLIAKRQVEIAHKEKADAVAHGATGKGNDQVRFELTYKALDPSLKIIAPWREWDITSREEAIEYAKKYHIPIGVTKEKPYSRDRNLWHLSHEGGRLEDPWQEPHEDMFMLTNSPEDAPDRPVYLIIGFKKGIPKTINGKAYNSVALIETLNRVAGRHGVGRMDMVENRLVGIKSRGVYECPAGTVLFIAHRDLESITIDRETMHYKEIISQRYAELVYYGMWFSQQKKALDRFIDATQENVTGEVRVKLYKGNCTVVGRRSRYSLYDQRLGGFGMRGYNPKDAEGFINLLGLPLKVQSLIDNSHL